MSDKKTQNEDILSEPLLHKIQCNRVAENKSKIAKSQKCYLPKG